jgi:hypothetical protein
MPFFLTTDLITNEPDFFNVPIIVNSIDETREVSLFYKCEGGRGGALGKKSSEPQIYTFKDEIKTAQTSYTSLNYNKNVGVKINPGEKNDAGYAIKYITGNDAEPQMSGTLQVKYQPSIPVNLNLASPDNSSWRFNNQGINAQIVKKFSPYPYTGLAFHCEFTYDPIEGLINIDKLQEPNGDIYSMNPLHNYTGTSLYLSGSGDVTDYESSVRVFNIDRSGLYGYSHYSGWEESISDSGVVFLCGSGGFIDDGNLIMGYSGFNFISADQYKDENYYYYSLPFSGFIRMNPTDDRWGSMLNFYVVDLDYDDKDRKLEPEFISNTDDIYYNDKISGCMDHNFEFYYKKETSNNPSSCSFPFVSLGHVQKSNPDDIIDNFILPNNSKSSSDTSLFVKIERQSKQISVEDNDSFFVTEKLNTFELVSDHFGFYNSDTNIYTKKYNLLTSSVPKIELDRGAFSQDYQNEPYDSFDRIKIRNKSKFMIIHHGFNAVTNTYFWGVNGKNITWDNFLDNKLINENGIREQGVYCPFIYINNFCVKNEFVGAAEAVPSTKFHRKYIKNDRTW